MPIGPTGEWRPDDLIACAVHVAKIATGQIEETYEPPAEPEDATPSPAVAGGRARAAKLTADERAAQARRAANARWGKRADA